MRVIVEPPVFQPDAVRPLLDGCDVVVESPARPWMGDDVIGLLVWQPVTADDMDRLPRLRVIVTGSIGFDHIDLEAAKRRGIWVCNVPDYCVEEVADTTIALLIALVRGITFLDRSVAAGRWDDHAAGSLPRLSQLRLGIVGFGQIGRAVARRAQALRMETWATDPLVPAETINAAGVRAAALDELLQGVTALSLHLPLTTQTAKLIGARELSLLPEGSYLVNTARGQLVDLDALLAALDSDHLAGAALDVLPIEPPAAGHAPRHERLIVTPHAAWYSPTAEREVVRKATAELRAILTGDRPASVVIAGKLALD